MKTPVTLELKKVIETHPDIEQVHFTANGHYHFRVFPHGNDLYTRLEEVPETTKSGIQIPNKFTTAPIKGRDNQDDPEFKVVATLTREEVLSAPIEEGPTKPLILTNSERLLAASELTAEELQQLLKDKKPKK